jgi:superfamily II RNA helicase
MVLNLLLSHSPGDIRQVFERSLAAYQLGRKGKVSKGADTLLWKDFQRHLAFLKQEGFVDTEDRLTEDGLWASKLRLDQPLLIAECLRKQVFPTGNPALLAGIIAPFVYDGDLEVTIYKREVPRKLKVLYDTMVSTLTPLAERMKRAGFNVGKLPFWTAALMYQWAHGTDWDKLIARMGIADGDFTMLVSRTADNLRQIASLKEIYPQTAKLALEAREGILREPVVFE